MREVLGDLKENNLVANKNKCQFMRKFVEYLGHIILRKRVPSWLQTQKWSRVLEWPISRILKGVQGLLGFTINYQISFKDNGKMAKPLTDLTKKYGFHEVERCDNNSPSIKVTGFFKGICDWVKEIGMALVI